MKKLLFYFLLINSALIALHGQQDTVFNQIDTKGMKQGYWQKFYTNEKLIYKGEFKDNKPVGEMRRYYDNGILQSIMIFSEDGESAKARLFYEDGDVSAEGNFYAMQKDSLWKYYSYYTNTLVSEEYYIKGKKNSIHKSYYPNGQASEEIEWQNDIKEGSWVQYFEDGAIKLKCLHNFNMVNGRYYFYYPNGLIMILGTFIDDKRHGPWVFYDDNGKEKYKIQYNFGKAEDADKLIKNDEEYFKMIEENIGKFDDPVLEDFFREGEY